MTNDEFTTYLRQQFRDYRAMAKFNSKQKQQKREFINGLMTAAKLFGVSYEQLERIVIEEDCRPDNTAEQLALDVNDLDIPTIIRWGHEVELE